MRVGGFEILAGLMIAVNFGARFFAILLIFFVIATTFYFHDFWNQPAPENAKTLIDALKNLSIIGALFMIAGYGRGPRPNEAGLRGRVVSIHSSALRRHGVTLTSFAASSICGSPACRPCAARISCGVRAGTPGKQGSPPGRRTCGATESQNAS